MKRKPLVLWGIAAVLLVSYIGILFMSISANDQRIQIKAYEDWRNAYVRPAAVGSYVNTTVGKQTALSEAQGYGMVITVLAAEKGFATETDFKELVAYYQAHQLSDTNALMAWKQEETKQGWQSVSQHNATDGDLDIAYALVLAAELWPDSGYQQLAQQLLTTIQQYNYNPETGFLTVGDWATVDKKASTLLRPSDVMPSYFEKFYDFTQDAFWQQVKTRGLALLTELSDDKTGLIPDFAWIGEKVTPAKANEVSNAYDGDYSDNACRIPMRLALSDDEVSRKLLDKMLPFFNEQTVVYAGYTLKGKSLQDYQSLAFSAPLLLAGKQDAAYSGLITSQNWVIAEPIQGDNYYNETLKVLVTLWMYPVK